MVSLVRYCFVLWRARADLKKLEARRVADIRRAHQQKESQNDMAGLETYWGTEISYCYENIDSIKTMRLLHLAERYDIEPPPRELNSADWTEDSRYGEWYLTSAGRAKLRAAIRGERQERRERLTWWVPLVFGVIGALTGLISILKQ